MTRSKIVWDREWVKVRNMMNTHFRAAAPCAWCRKLTCGMVWYNIHSREVRCVKCFTPEQLK